MFVKKYRWAFLVGYSNGWSAGIVSVLMLYLLAYVVGWMGVPDTALKPLAPDSIGIAAPAPEEQILR
ncbi:MAG: hypothetical protein WBG19_09645 [Thermoplasmata archaeon]